jgi:hypothetical protein
MNIGVNTEPTLPQTMRTFYTAQCRGGGGNMLQFQVLLHLHECELNYSALIPTSYRAQCRGGGEGP